MKPPKISAFLTEDTAVDVRQHGSAVWVDFSGANGVSLVFFGSLDLQRAVAGAWLAAIDHADAEAGGGS